MTEYYFCFKCVTFRSDFMIEERIAVFPAFKGGNMNTLQNYGGDFVPPNYRVFTIITHVQVLLFL